MNPNKIFVEVIAKYDLDGKILPQAIVWNDGRVFEIDKVLDVRQAASLKAGGQGIRYLCRIKNQQRYLFPEDDMYWFIKGAKP